jgi:hypothetical protein
MAKRSLSTTSLTPLAVADAVAYTNSTGYLGTIFGATATQRTNILEVYLGGQATVSAPAVILLARDSTVPGTLVAGSTFDVPLDAATATTGLAVTGNSATTPAQRSATGHLLNLSFNAFGGIVRWLAAPGEEISVIGTAVSLGSASLSAFTGSSASALMGSHIIYETL